MPATITTLPQRVAALPGELRAVCDELFAIGASHGVLEMPPTMLAWAEQQFGNTDSVTHQTIIKVVNRLTLEGALFNPLRAKRPAMHSGDDAELEAWIAAELRDDIFAHPLCTTPADRFGRIRGAHCISASNVAKYDGWHGVVVFDEPHPLRFARARS